MSGRRLLPPSPSFPISDTPGLVAPLRVFFIKFKVFQLVSWRPRRGAEAGEKVERKPGEKSLEGGLVRSDDGDISGGK